MISGPEAFMVTLNVEAVFIINVTDTNLVSFNISNGEVEGSELRTVDGSLHIFTWTPVEAINRSIIFTASDDLGVSSHYEPRIEICSCLNNGTCTLDGVINRVTNPIDLNCVCPEGNSESKSTLLH